MRGRQSWSSSIARWTLLPPSSRRENAGVLQSVRLSPRSSRAATPEREPFARLTLHSDMPLPARLQQHEPWTDEQIIARVLSGDSQLFELIMRRHNERLYRAIRSILRDEAEVEDAMQAAYLHAYAHLRDFEGRSSLATWLTRIAIHEALGRRRRGLRTVTGEEEVELPAGIQSPEDDAT